MPQAASQAPPGTVWAYNNTGFSPAGRLLEVLTGKTYEDAIADLVFRPLGLDHSLFLPEDVMTHRFAAGHTLGEGKPSVAQLWALHRSSSAAGAIVTDVHDQLRYARFHLGDGTGSDEERVLSAETMALMQSPQVEIGEGIEAVGIAWMLGSIGRARTVAHGGVTNGQTAAFAMIPDHDFALVILTNAFSGGALAQRIEKWTHEHVLGLSQPDPEPVELSQELLDEYVGTYERETVAIEVARDGTGLRIQVRPLKSPPGWDRVPPPPPMRASFTESDRLVVLEGPGQGMRGTFLRSPDGAIEWFRENLRLARRM